MPTTRCAPDLPQGEIVSRTASRQGAYLVREPTAADGRAVWDLIATCRPLDTNSLYCNLLQCTHFADTCIVAEQDKQIRGWVSAYRPPTEPGTLFIWQVATHPDTRRGGLASSLIKALLGRDAARGVRQLKATIMPDNRASWALFRSLAETLNAPLTSQEHFACDKHFGGQHQSEHMLTVGPWPAPVTAELGPAHPPGSIT